MEIKTQIETYNEKGLFYKTYKDTLSLARKYCFPPPPTPSMLIFKKKSPFYTLGCPPFSTTNMSMFSVLCVCVGG